MVRVWSASVARLVVAGVVALASVTTPARATTVTCAELEAQLLAASPRTRDPAKVKRYTSAVKRQRGELARARKTLARAGCARRKTKGCRKLSGTIAQMEQRADELQTLLDRAMGRAGSPTQRSRILQKLTEQGCRARQTAPEQQPGGDELPGASVVQVVGNRAVKGGDGYQTMCVRTCDGYYFPISNFTGRASFAANSRQCANMCPQAETRLFVGPAGTPVEKMADSFGRRYSAMPFAFQHQSRNYTPSKSCTCGQPRATRQFKAKLRGPSASVDALRETKPISQLDGETRRNADVNFGWSEAEQLSKRAPSTGPRKIRVVGPRFFPDR